MTQSTVLPTPTNGKEASKPQTEGPPPPGPPTEVVPRARRRSFTAEYKRGILQEADSCTQSSQVGALLRREGLYSSHLTVWRRQREQGELGLQKRGPSPADPPPKEMARLRRDNERLRKRLEQAETIIAVQKNSPTYLGSPAKHPPRTAADDPDGPTPGRNRGRVHRLHRAGGTPQ